MIQESWRWIRDLTLKQGENGVGLWPALDDIVGEMNGAIPGFGDRAAHVAPPASFRIHGKKAARQPHRYSGRTAMRADEIISEPPPPPDPDSPLRFSMEGYHFGGDPALIPIFWAPGWNSVQATNKFQQEVGGPLRGGDPGVRLLEPESGAAPSFFISIPKAFEPRSGEWLALPLYHIFGSEELSNHARGIAERIPVPYVALSVGDAEGLGLHPEDVAIVEIGAREYRLPVTINKELPGGTVGIPVGLNGMEGIVTPSWCRIKKEVTG
jgi:NADH-quinone oxidoreductase subunit G